MSSSSTSTTTSSSSTTTSASSASSPPDFNHDKTPSSHSSSGSEYNPSPPTHRQPRHKFIRRRHRPTRRQQKFCARRRRTDYASDTTAPTDCSSGCASPVIAGVKIEGVGVVRENLEACAVSREKLGSVKSVVSRKRKAVESVEKPEFSVTGQRKPKMGGIIIAPRRPMPKFQPKPAKTTIPMKKKAADLIGQPQNTGTDQKKPKTGNIDISLRPLIKRLVAKSQDSSLPWQSYVYQWQSQQNPYGAADFPASQVHPDCQEIFLTDLHRDSSSLDARSQKANEYFSQQSEFLANPISQVVTVYANQLNQQPANSSYAHRGGYQANAQAHNAAQNRRENGYPTPPQQQFNGYENGHRHHQPQGYQGHPAQYQGHPAQYQSYPAQYQGHPAQYQGHPAQYQGHPAQFQESPGVYPGNPQLQGPQGHFAVNPQPHIQHGTVYCQPQLQPQPNPLAGVQPVSNLNPLRAGPGSVMQSAPDLTRSVGTSVSASPALNDSILAASPQHQALVIFQKPKSQMTYSCCEHCEYFGLVSHTLCTCGCLFPGSADLYANEFYKKLKQSAKE